MMKKVLLICNCLLTVLVLYMGVRYFWHDSRPFDDIYQWNITAIYAYCYDYPPYEVPKEEYKELLDALSHVVIHQRDDSYTDYMGLAPCTFWIETQDGERKIVSSANPFFFIDGIAYRTEVTTSYEVAEIHREYQNLIVSNSEK